DKFVKLFYKVVGNGLKLVFGISIGIMGIYKLTLPYIDVAIKKSAFSISSSFLPVVGDASKGALEFVLSCAQLIKNSFAIGVIIWIVIVASVPLIKMVAYTFLYHLAGAIIQPVGDKKMSEIASILGKGCEFILSCTGTVVLLTIVVMIVCCSIGTSIT
ncbi:MAG: stage III sporulation protein AE, partial [Cellulosilyticaceae bacterium]